MALVCGFQNQEAELSDRMKTRLLNTILFLLAVASVRAQDIPRAVSIQSVSADVLGVEYSYEQALGGSWTLIGRVGLPPMVTSAARSDHGLSVVTEASPAISLESRYYTTLARRVRKGRSILSNSSDYIMLRLVGAYMLRDTDPYEAKIIVAYGIRRAWNRVYIEPTFGAGYHTQAKIILPHLQFRVGIPF